MRCQTMRVAGGWRSVVLCPALSALFANSHTLAALPEKKKWGDGFAHRVWDFVEFDAAAGELKVNVTKVHLAAGDFIQLKH